MRSLIIVFLLSIAVTVKAQDLELGVWGGVSFYAGDLSPTDYADYFNTFKPAGGILLRYNPVNPVSMELGLNLGRIAGEDGVTNDNQERDLNFRTNITELSLKFNWNIFRLGSPRRTQVVPYLMVGASVFRFNPETDYDGNWIELQPLGTEAQGVVGYADKYSLTEFALMAGPGLKFIISKKMTIGLEFGARYTNTDYLDDVSGVALNYADVLNNGSLAATLSNPRITDPETQNLDYERGTTNKDWFYMSGISFSFAFGEGSGVRGKGIGCPTF